MITEFITRVFDTRNAAHQEHLRTSSYAAHVALADFYKAVIPAVDAVAEAWQGAFGDLPDAEMEMPGSEEDILPRLQEEADWIEVNRKEIANDHDAVANLVDGVTAVYLAAIYKLGRFK